MNNFNSKLYSFLTPKSKGKAEDKLIEQLEMLDIDSFQRNGAYISDQTHFNRSAVDVHSILRKQAQLINIYRSIEHDPEIDFAIDNVVNDAVVQDQDENAVEIDLSGVSELSDDLKSKLIDAHKYNHDLMDFNVNGYDQFRRWYVDGASYFHVVVNQKKPRDGIQKIISLDPKCMKKIVEIKRGRNSDGIEVISNLREYYTYSTENGDNTSNSFFKTYGQEVQFPSETIIHINSGIYQDSLILSHLDRSRKTLTNLNRIEDMLVVFRLTRGVDRRAFYIDVGSLAPKSVEKYILDIAQRYKSKLIYNSATGDIKGMGNAMGMQDDFFLPRREGGKGTEIQSLDGNAEFLRGLDDIGLFQGKLRRSTKVPLGRFEKEDGGMLGSRLAEITREELLFSKYISRLRNRFSELFKELLRKQVLLTGIITEEEWNTKVAGFVKFSYSSDRIIKESRDGEIMAEKIQAYDSLNQAGMIGKHYSNEFVQKNVLGMSDDDIRIEQEKIKEERAAGMHSKTDAFGDPIESDEGGF